VARLVFTANLQRHVASPTIEVTAATVREGLEVVFAATPVLRSYLLDDQGRLRKHMSIFVDGEQVRDRAGLSDRLGADSEVYVMQALSGG
jgi:molybdopterin synthase sulfur carrier subunit